jgi:hypothetical protein
MKKSSWVYLSTAVVALTLLLSSCKKKESSTTTKPASISSFIIETDNNYRIYKVTSSLPNNYNTITEYVYSLGSIQETLTASSNKGVRVYFINNFGLADSSHYSGYFNNVLSSKWTSYFLYDSNNYLKMRINKRTDQTSQKPDTTFYDNLNGNIMKIRYSNRVFGISWPTSCTYSYNATKNFIDIDSFTGAFLGILSKNLIESVLEYGNPEGTVQRSYKYLFNSKGLVVERTKICATQADWMDRFEYIIR